MQGISIDYENIQVNNNQKECVMSGYPDTNIYRLCDAAEEGDKGAILSLIQRTRVTVNSSDPDGVTALISAAKKGEHETVEYLLSIGANVDHQDGYFRDALTYAARFKHKGVARVLLNGNASVTQSDD